MLTLCLTLTLLAEPGARLLPESQAPLSNDEIAKPLLAERQELRPQAAEAEQQELIELRRQLNILEGHIMELKPRMPGGFIAGMAIGFSIAAILVPGLPLLLIGGLSGTAPILAAGAVLSGIGGVGLLVAIICLIAGNNAESDLADERARLVELRDQLRARLGNVPPTVPRPSVPPPWVPGVQREVAPRLITIARF